MNDEGEKYKKKKKKKIEGLLTKSLIVRARWRFHASDSSNVRPYFGGVVKSDPKFSDAIPRHRRHKFFVVGGASSDGSRVIVKPSKSPSIYYPPALIVDSINSRPISSRPQRSRAKFSESVAPASFRATGCPCLSDQTCRNLLNTSSRTIIRARGRYLYPARFIPRILCHILSA